MKQYQTTPFLFITLLSDVLRLLLVMRFLFLFFRANAGNALVAELYAITDPFVLLFRSVFPSTVIGGFVIEWSALIAMVLSAVFTALLIRLLNLLMFLAEGGPDEHIHHLHHV